MIELNRESRRLCVIVALTGLLLSPVVGCASSPDQRSESEPDQIMGQPPGEDSEDYEFAPPPRHPGEHGDIERRAKGGPATTDREPDVIYRSEIAELQNYGPSVIFEHVDTEPTHEDGSFVGFQIVDVSETARTVLHPHVRVGDVITHVNLVRLERPDDYLEAWKTLEDVQEIRIDFQRDGEANQAVWRVQ